MHASVRDWITKEVRGWDLHDGKVLDVGSLDVNGSVRDLFGFDYTGIDFREGPNVDQVMNAHKLQFPANTFDVVVACELFEHDDEFWTSLKEMGRVLKKGGHLLITTRGNGFKLHEHPEDFWRFMPSARKRLLELAKCEMILGELDPQAPGIFAHGVKR